MTLYVRLQYLGSVESPRDEELEVDSERFTIGRGAANDLRLVDREKLISGSHAFISLGSDGYYMTDTSTNGVLLNGSPITRDVEVYLQAGDELRIGDYQMVVQKVDLAGSVPSLDPPASVSASASGTSGSIGEMLDNSDPFADPLDAIAPASPRTPPQNRVEPTMDPLDMLSHGQHDDPFALLDREQNTGPGVSESTSAGSIDSAPGSPLDDFVELPGRAPDPALTGSSDQTDLPDWAMELVSPEPQKPLEVQPPAQEVPPAPPPVRQEPEPPLPTAGRPAPPPEPAPAPLTQAPGSESDIAAALLQGLNLDVRGPVDANLAFTVGALLRTLLQGVIEMLHARSEFKNTMRLSRTIIQAQDNNPFKVAVNAEDLLELLFVHPRRGYLTAEDAVEETVADLASHELAVLEGLRSVGKELATLLDPKVLEQEFANNPKFSASLGLLQKSKYWEAYESFHTTDLADGELVIETFTKVYDEALRQLKQQRQQ